jgi:hypothetical protein
MAVHQLRTFLLQYHFFRMTHLRVMNVLHDLISSRFTVSLAFSLPSPKKSWTMPSRSSLTTKNRKRTRKTRPRFPKSESSFMRCTSMRRGSLSIKGSLRLRRNDGIRYWSSDSRFSVPVLSRFNLPSMNFLNEGCFHLQFSKTGR